MYTDIQAKHLLFLSVFGARWIFSTHFKNILHYQFE